MLIQLFVIHISRRLFILILNIQEKKPLHHFLPGSGIFSIGTIGCNFKCDFCQNWDISQVEEICGGKIAASDIEESALGRRLPPQQLTNYCVQNKIPSVAFTYNEPTVFIDYALDVAKLVKAHGMRTVFVTNGYETPEAIDLLKGYIDAMNIDVKGFTETFYQKHCKASLKHVLETVEYAKKQGIWVETTTLLIPDENDGDDELDKLTKWLAGVDHSIPWHISAYHPDYKFTSKARTPLSTLERAYAIGKRNGLQFIYMGNVGGSGKCNTECPKCGTTLVRRRGMMDTRVDSSAFDLTTGTCKKCGASIPGIWS